MLLLPIVLLTACVDTLDDYNKDQKKASEIPPRTLFTNALKGLTDILTTPNVNSNNYRMFVQYWATTTYLDEPRYSMTSRLYSQNLWNAIYRDVLSDLKEAKRLLDLDVTLDPAVKNNQLGMIGILEVYSWDVLVKTFGGVPYSEALDPENLLPEYEDAQTIYNDLITRLDASLALLTSGTSMGTADLIYNGDVAKWKKFGNSLKMKMGLTIADVDNGKAKTMVEAAVTAGVISSNTENARFPYIAASPNNNPVSANVNPIFTSREDFIVTSTLVNAMLGDNRTETGTTDDDPRLASYFTKTDTIKYDKYAGGKPTEDAKPLDTVSVYYGGKYGFSNAFANYSHVSTKIAEPTFEGMLIEYAEVEFMLAEAAARGYTTGKTAKEHYDRAVGASISYWTGVTAGADTDGIPNNADNYLAAPENDFNTYDPSKPQYGLNPLQKIARQRWIALFNRGWESWVQWRRLDFPTLAPPLASLKIPVRMIYPPSEGTVNTAPYEAAVAKIPGGVDSPDAKLFWDKF